MPEKVSKDDILRSLRERPVLEIFEKEGVTCELLAKKLKRELNAKETKVFKAKVEIPIKAEDSKSEDSKNERVEIEQIIYSKPLIAWEVRQRARQDAHKLLGHYPSEKHDLKFSGTLNIAERLRNAIGRREADRKKDERKHRGYKKRAG